MTNILRLLPLLLLPALAACDSGPKAPAAPTPAAPVTTTTTAPAAETPAKPAAVSQPAGFDSSPLVGRWAADLGQCASAAVVIAANKYEADGTACDMSLAPGTGGAATATLTCGGKTERVSMTPVFAPTGEGINLVYLDRNNAKATVLRCRGS